MLIDKSVVLLIGALVALPFIAFFAHRLMAYKRLQTILNVNGKVLSKKTVLLSLIWFISFSMYLSFGDILPSEMGKFGMLSYISFPVIIMLFGGSLYRKALISIVFTLIYGISIFLIIYLLGKVGYYDQFLRSGEPTAPFITTLFIPFSIIVSIIFLVTAIADTIVTKIRHSK